MRSLKFFLFLVIPTVCSENQFSVKNGASYLYPKLDKPGPLSEKFELIRKADYMKGVYTYNFLDRVSKVKLLALWMDEYEYPLKYDLLDMYERMLLIQSNVKWMMKSAAVREDLLKRELNRNETIDKKQGKQSKMQYIIDSVKSNTTVARLNICSYFNYDFTWFDRYNSTVFSPAKEMLLDYYFSKDVLKILKSKNMTEDEKLQKIWSSNQDKSEREKTYMNQMYQQYLAENSLSGFFIG